MKHLFDSFKLLAVFFAICSFTAISVKASCNASFTQSVNGQVVTFTNTSTGITNTTYFYWNFGDNQTATTQNAVHTYQYGGNYTVCLYFIDSVNNVYCTFCDSVFINGPQQPCHAAFTFQDIGNYTGSFSSTSSGVTSNTVYSWSYGDNTSGTQSYNMHFYGSSGWYNVCLYITDPSTQCSDSTCQMVYINPNNSSCSPSFSYTTGMNLGTFTNTSTGTTSYTIYSWSFGDNTYGSGQNISHSYVFPGWYYVCLTITDSTTLCNSTACQYIYIPGTNNSTCAASFTHTANGSTVTFTNTSTGITNQTGYQWNFGDGNYGYNQNENHTYQYGGTYTVCLSIWDSSQTCSSSYCDTVTVSGPSQPCHASFVTWPDTANPHNTFAYNTSTGTNPMHYDWNWGDNTPDDTLPYPSHTYPSSGIYTICLTITDANGCSSTYCDTVNVQRLSADWVSVPSTINVINPNPAGINELDIASLVTLYPNPATDAIYLSGKDLGKMKYKIYDVVGNLISGGTLQSNSIHVNELEAGAYLLQITDASGKPFTKRFIKN